MGVGFRRVGERPHPRPAVSSPLSGDFAAELDRRRREVSRLRNDPGHRPGVREEAGARLRREGVRCHREQTRAPARGRRHRPGAGEAHHWRLRRAEGGARDHGVPARPRGRHRACGADIQDLWRGGGGGDDGEPLSPRPRRARHRVQDRRHHRDAPGVREERDGAGPGRDLLRARRGDGRGALRSAAGQVVAPRRGPARRPGGARFRCARFRAERRDGGRGSGRRHAVHLPRRPAPSRDGDRGAPPGTGPGRAALAAASRRTRRYRGSRNASA